MKNVISLFTLLSIQLTAQIDLNEVPKIGFADLKELSRAPFIINVKNF